MSIRISSKRCHYISRLPSSQRSALNSRLAHLAESMGGKESGFGLCKLSKVEDIQVRLILVCFVTNAIFIFLLFLLFDSNFQLLLLVYISSLPH